MLSSSWKSNTFSYPFIFLFNLYNINKIIRIKKKSFYLFQQRKPKKDNQGGKIRRENQKTKKIEDVVKLRFRSLDRFQVCLAICRTSSASVRHENTYKDPYSKHCYYNSPGNILHQRTERDLISSNNNKGDNVAITSFSTVSLIIPSIYSPHPVYIHI